MNTPQRDGAFGPDGFAEGLVDSCGLPYSLVPLSAGEYRVHFSSERLTPRPKHHPGEFRQRAVALVRSGKPVKHFAEDLGVSAGGLHRWVRQDRIDRGEIPDISTSESVELTRARKRIHELEQELEIVKRAAKLVGEDAPHPKGSAR